VAADLPGKNGARVRDFVDAREAPPSVCLRTETVPVVSTPEGWGEVDGALERTFEFESFPAAIAYVNAVARIAERENHHPEIAVDYRRVTLRWSTHSAGGITDRDRELAALSTSLTE
jgi:4a-hydroxytetrahydrobiopterin dehydratase